jgi:hypothetical protein
MTAEQIKSLVDLVDASRAERDKWAAEGEALMAQARDVKTAYGAADAAFEGYRVELEKAVATFGAGTE